MDPKVLNRIARLDLRARLIVEGYVSGRHRSPYRGFSVEFAEHREYAPGDDPRYLDWKVYGKSDRLYIKQYEEETNLVATICLDVSTSMNYGGEDRLSKADYARTVAAAIAYLVIHQQDAAALVQFDDTVRDIISAGSQPVHLQRMLSRMDTIEGGARTDIAKVLGEVAEKVRRRGLVVLVSDLLDDVENVMTGLRRLRSRRHDVVVFHVLDHDEVTFPFDRMTRFEGIEAPNPELLADPSSLRTAYLDALEEFRGALRARCLAERIDYVPLDTATSLDVALSGYLAARAGGRR
ncbi:MAG: DUF58 domain-containing protein [Planctomycetota bacterium]